MRSRVNWEQLTMDQAYKLSQAEFKGMVTQALQDIRDDVKTMQRNNANTHYIAMFLGGLSGIITSAIPQLHAIFGSRPS